MSIQFSTVAEAEAAASRLGVEAHYGRHLDLANLSNTMLLTLADKKQELPYRVIVDVVKFAEYAAPTQIPALSLHAEPYINPAATHWLGPADNSEIQHAARRWSTSDPLHPLFHEAGHFVHCKAARQVYDQWHEDDLTPRQKTQVVVAVSKYAVSDLYEFMSEVYAMLILGLPVPRGIMAIYRKKGGIVP